jgi:hypothetical protein
MKNLIQKVYSCEKESAGVGIANALIWAAVIIAASWLTRGSEHADALFVIILTASTTAFLFTDRQRKNM